MSPKGRVGQGPGPGAHPHPSANVPGPQPARSLWGGWGPAAWIFVAVAGVFLPALSHGFITYDDPTYVTENAHVTAGLGWEGLRWAFGATDASNWHPLTWISHMVDYQVFGMRAWGHHLTSVLLHAANAALLFLALRRMTGDAGPSLFVAGLFGLHPLHVESVAWVAERKDVLSTFFLMLVLIAYAKRAESLRLGRPGAWIHYAAALVLFGLGLMCKPMLVTLPCALLLLDFWPLSRWRGGTASARLLLAAEKVPFLFLAAAASLATLHAQGHGGAIGSADEFPIGVRLAHAPVAYVGYLAKCFFPRHLAIFYPFFGETPPVAATLLAVGLLLAITLVSAVWIRRPYLIVGWLWFVGTLVPVIGLVQVGGQAMADRYTYVPLIGIFIMLAWSAADLGAFWRVSRRAMTAAGCAVMVVLGILTSHQLSFWSDGEVLFRHAAAVTQNNWVAHANLYATLARSAKPEARAELEQTLGILAAFAEKHDQKGVELAGQGRSAEAVAEFRKAIQIMNTLPGPHFNLGTTLARLPGKLPEAAEEFQKAVDLKPDFVEARFNLALAMARTPGRTAQAVEQFRQTVSLKPDYAEAWYSLGIMLGASKDGEGEAAQAYRRVVALRPDFYQAHFRLGMILARDPSKRDEAIKELEDALRLRPDLTQAKAMIEQLGSTAGR